MLAKIQQTPQPTKQMSKKQQDYDAFVEKFKPKKTTDDCYTPPLVYDAVLRWAHQTFNIGNRPVVRPFYPGGDYEHADYPPGCVVIDNPPFSIFSRIVQFYTSRGIDFLLFAPLLTSIRTECTYIGVGSTVIYENGASVNTSFVTNMMPGIVCLSAPDLRRAVDAAVAATQKEQKKTLTKRSYPPCVLRASMLHTLSQAGVSFCVHRDDGIVVSKLSTQKDSEFGNSVLLSSRAARRLSEAKTLAQERQREIERQRAVPMQLSERSLDLIRQMDERE